MLLLLIDGLVQERCNSIANALELPLSCTNPSYCEPYQCSNPPETQHFYWNENIIILKKFSSLGVLEVVILTTSRATSDQNLIQMKTFLFQCGANTESESK